MGHRPPDHRRAIAASAAGWPRVRAPSMAAAGQTGSAGAAVLRVVRRFGAAARSRHRRSRSPRRRVAFAAAGLRVAVGFGAGFGAAPRPSPVGSARGRRPRSRPPACGSPVGLAAALAGRRLVAGAPVLRVGRDALARPRRSTVSAVGGLGQSRSRPRSDVGGRCLAGRPASRLAGPTWARSIASSSGGTSLHGSFEPRAAGAGLRPVARRGRRPRSSRGPACRRLGSRPLTSG